MSAPFNCAVCGDREHANYIDEVRDRLVKNEQCFTCDFWMEKIRWRTEKRSDCFVINGVHYKVGEELSPSVIALRGFGGSRFVIIANDDGRRIETRNLWCQGKVPDRFRDVLTDNATFEKV